MKVFLLRKRHLILGLGVLLTAAIFCAVNIPTAVTAAAATRQLPIYCVARDDNLVSISFDAAWGNAILRYGNLMPAYLFSNIYGREAICQQVQVFPPKNKKAEAQPPDEPMTALPLFFSCYAGIIASCVFRYIIHFCNH